MHQLIGLALIAGTLLAACAAPTSQDGGSGAITPAPSPAGATLMITGTVTAGPVCPVEQNPPDPACAPRPVAGAVIVATDDTGTEVCRATSDRGGGYELVILDAGTVLVTAEPVAGLMGAPEPVTVDLVEPGQVVRLDLAYDTGIR